MWKRKRKRLKNNRFHIPGCQTSHALWNGNDGSDGKTGGKNGSCRVENGEMGTGSDKKEQDKTRIRERDCENRKARGQTSECKATRYGHVKRREEGYVGKTIMEMAVPGRRKRGRPRRRWMDLAREDMERV